VYDDFSANAFADNTKFAVFIAPAVRPLVTGVSDTAAKSIESSLIDQVEVHEAFKSILAPIINVSPVLKLVKVFESVVIDITGATASIISTLISFSDTRVES
jgi:hypothetical protein